MKTLDPNHLVFLDECAVALWMTRNYGWSKRGEDAVIVRPHRGTHLSVIGALRLTGVVAPMVVDGPVDGDTFCQWLREFLLPHLGPGDLVVMDNLSTHKVAQVDVILASVGAKALYLPPYSPDLNPIEMLWSVAKAKLGAATARTRDRVADVLGRVFRNLPAQTPLNWWRHCGYAEPST